MDQKKEISFVKQAARGGIWLAGFKFAAQGISWVSTLVVARILAPGDYGLMEMATILTGYVALFSELGLGSAIIQRKEIKDEELSSLFWCSVVWGFMLSALCILLSYPTVLIFNEKRLLRVTQLVSFLFILGAISIVPSNILNRNLEFKKLGVIEAVSVIIASGMMILIAKYGGGVWTLIWGHIIREFARCNLTFLMTPWRPKFHFHWESVRSYVSFGINVAAANSLAYIYNKSDRFFGGRTLGSNGLGFYSIALQLSSIPMDKFISLINRVSYPVISKKQNDVGDFKEFFLKLTKLIALITLPVYTGSFVIADQLIPLLLGPKWIPTVFPFKILCLAQLVISITTPIAIANMAQGRPNWNLYSSLANVIILPFSFFISAKYGVNALALPWITVYPILRIGFAWLTIRKMGLSMPEYIKNLKHGFLGTALMIAILLIEQIAFKTPLSLEYIKLYVIFTIISAGGIYIGYQFAFQRAFLKTLIKVTR